jgi:hypothetical protein
VHALASRVDLEGVRADEVALHEVELGLGDALGAEGVQQLELEGEAAAASVAAGAVHIVNASRWRSKPARDEAP